MSAAERPAHDDELDAWLTASRKAQGLPRRIEDPEVLRKVARLMTGGRHTFRRPTSGGHRTPSSPIDASQPPTEKATKT